MKQTIVSKTEEILPVLPLTLTASQLPKLSATSRLTESPRLLVTVVVATVATVLLASCRQQPVEAQEPMVEVGIVSAEHIPLTLSGSYRASNDSPTLKGSCLTAEGQVLSDGVYEADRSWAGITLAPTSDTCRFTLEAVRIGIGFHWQRDEQQRFAGSLKFILNEDSLLTAVNVLPVEQYLLSVISSEMKATSSVELLKAHAVISRSWLLSNLRADAQQETDAGCASAANSTEGKNSPIHAVTTSHSSSTCFDTDTSHIKWYERDAHTLFDVCADDHCQRYQGIGKATTPQVREALEATRGLVLTDADGHLCDTRYGKCCGGRTEIFSSAWGDVDYDYLQSVEDPFCNTSDTAILAQVLNGYDLETTDFYRWTVRYTTEELSEIVRTKSGLDFGRILALEPLERGPSGRITRLRIVGDKLTLTVGKELEIRKFLSRSHLYSSAFTVETEYPSPGASPTFLSVETAHPSPGASPTALTAKTECSASETSPTAFILHGSGWGHGVGLCQIGAAVMASQGYNFKQILTHYYPHTSLTRLYE